MQRGSGGECWHATVARGNPPAETTARYLSKGRPVAIDGRLDWHEWNAQDGSTHQAVQIIADAVQFLGPAGSEHHRHRRPRSRTQNRRQLRRRHSVLTCEEPTHDGHTAPITPLSERARRMSASGGVVGVA